MPERGNATTQAPLAAPSIQIRLPRPVKAVILDRNGTVPDTERVYVETSCETVAPFGDSLPHDFLHTLVGDSHHPEP